MTILMGLELENGLALAADGVVLLTADSGRVEAQQVMPKLWRHPLAEDDLAWGITGDASVGAQFKAWFEATSPESWDVLLAPAGEVLAKANREAKARARKAGAIKSFEPTSILMGGYLGADREGRLVSLGPTGSASPFPRGVLAVDSSEIAKVAAISAFNAAQQVAAPGTDPVAILVAALDATIATVPALGGPRQLVVIMRNRDA